MDTALYVPPGRHACRWWRECVELCRRMRWAIDVWTQDPATARRLAALGEVNRVVVARPAHARRVALTVAVAADPPGRPGGRDPGRPRRLR